MSSREVTDTPVASYVVMASFYSGLSLLAWWLWMDGFGWPWLPWLVVPVVWIVGYVLGPPVRHRLSEDRIWERKGLRERELELSMVSAAFVIEALRGASWLVLAGSGTTIHVVISPETADFRALLGSRLASSGSQIEITDQARQYLQSADSSEKVSGGPSAEYEEPNLYISWLRRKTGATPPVWPLILGWLALALITATVLTAIAKIDLGAAAIVSSMTLSLPYWLLMVPWALRRCGRRP